MSREDNGPRTAPWASARPWLVAAVLLVVYLLVVRGNFHVFHSLAEGFSIAVAWALFLLVWGARRQLRDDALVLLGGAFVFIGLIDLLHLLSYKGMGVFPGLTSANPPTQLWIAGRGLQAVAMLIYAATVGRRFRAWAWMWAYAAAAALLMLSVYPLRVFPACYVEGAGLTAFKVGAEYVVCAVFAAAGVALWRRRAAVDREVWRYILAALLFSILAELAFTLYVDVYGFFNRLGHFLKILAYLCVYRALIHAGLSRPIEVLYRDLMLKDRRLEEMARQHRTTLDNLPEVVVLLDPDLRVLWANEPARRLAGMSPEAMVGQRCHQVWRRSDRPCTNCAVMTAKKTGTRADTFQESQDGAVFHYRACPIHDETGEVVQFLEVLEDVTDRVHAERALRASEEKFARVFRNAPHLTAISTLEEGRYIDVNEAFLQATGLSRETIIGRTSVELGLLTEAERGDFAARVRADGAVRNLEMEVTDARGVRRVGLQSSELVELDGVPCIVSTTVDITERRRLEAEQAEQLARMQVLLESFQQGVLMEDLDRRVVFANTDLGRIFGMEGVEALVGQDCREAAQAVAALFADAEGFLRGIEARVAKGKVTAPEDLELADGRVLSLAYAPVGREGRSYGHLWTYRDRTAEVRLARDYQALFQGTLSGFALQEMLPEEPGELPDFRFLEINPAYERITGLGRDIIGRTLREVLPEVESHWLDAYARVVETGEPLHLERYSAEIGRHLEVAAFRPARGQFAVLLTDVTDRRQQELLQEARLRLLRCVSAEHSMHDLLRAILDEVESLTDSQVGFYHFVEADQETLSLQAWSTNTVQHLCTAVGEGLHYPIAEAGVWTDCVREGGPVIHNDYASLPHRRGMPEGHVSLVRELVVPVVRGERMVAVLGVGNKPSDYHDGDVAMVGQLADLAWEMVERMRAQEALRRSEQRYREFVEHSLEGVYMLALETPVDTALPVEEQVAAIWEGTSLVECNQALARYYGAESPEGVVGTTLRLLLGGRPPEENEATLRYFVENGYWREGVVEMIPNPQGEERWYRAMSVGMVEGGKLARIWGTQVDVTGEREGDLELERLHAAIEQAAEAVIVVDADGVVRYVNPAFETTTGYRTEEVVGQDSAVLPGMFRDGHPTLEVYNAVGAGHSWQGRLEMRRKDGTPLTVEATVAPVRDRAGTIVSYVSVQRDITQELALEEQLRQAQKMEAIGTLAGGIAHDFNNIIAAICGYAELLQEDLRERAPESLSHVEEILHGSERAAELVRQILTFSRKARSERHPFHFGPLVKETARMLRGAIPSSVTIEVDVAEEPCTVVGDVTQINQVIMNLVTNAWQAMAQTGGALSISVLPFDLGEGEAPPAPGLHPGSYVRLMVRDTGPGIAPDLVERIFEPFFTTKPQGEGTGMGLSVAHGVVKSHGGAITVESRPWMGATFSVFLPRAAADVDTSGTPEDGDGQAPEGTEHILVVDDEESFLFVTSRLLTSLGYQVTAVPGGEAGIETFLEAPDDFDLVVSDLSMPGVNGLALAERIHAARPGVGLVLCTGFGDKLMLAKAKEAGFGEVLMKPMRRHQLAAAVRRALDGQRGRY